jgi:A/G-specific adenine glycosylase
MRDAVLAWFDAHGRDLAFRRTRDPYAVLVSELMAQQTQIGRATEAWVAWMTRFPTVQALAAASPADVLRQWQGLGYNRRALNLHRAARAIVADHAGVVPGTVDVLQTLPGIGPYTARAVAAIAFGRKEGAVDTNVRRVLGRAVAGDPARLTASDLQAVADDAVPADRPGAWTHALMDIGATFCRPASPRCDACPVRRWCHFAASPVPPRARARPGNGTDQRFTSTTRWLRGRIVDRLRGAHDWTTFDRPIGEHDGAAVRDALQTLAREGLIELQPIGPHDLRARLPVG